jgi:hypothetical protein
VEDFEYFCACELLGKKLLVSFGSPAKSRTLFEVCEIGLTHLHVRNNSESAVQDIGLFTEFDFITLSLTAKTFLAWVVFSQVIVEQTN